jgi:hypothetical protein
MRGAKFLRNELGVQEGVRTANRKVVEGSSRVHTPARQMITSSFLPTALISRRRVVGEIDVGVQHENAPFPCNLLEVLDRFWTRAF